MLMGYSSHRERRGLSEDLQLHSTNSHLVEQIGKSLGFLNLSQNFLLGIYSVELGHPNQFLYPVILERVLSRLYRNQIDE